MILKSATDKSFYDTTGKRTNQWIKLKNKGLVGQNMRDTLDLIPIGAYHGKGKRAGYFGSFLMAAYDMQNNNFESICKLGTGFK